MGTLRAVVRALLIALISVAVLVAALPATALRLLGPRGDVASLRGVLALQRAWCRSSLAILGVRVAATGAPPRQACIVTANHLSYLDIAVLGSMRRMRFVSKAEVANWPGIGVLARLARVVFLRREERRDLLRVGDEIRLSLAAGVPVVFFPEGTSTCGLDVRPFHPGLLQPAAEGALPCLPVTLRYETPAQSPPPSLCVCWWGDMTFPPHFWRLMTLPSVRAEVRWGSEAVTASDRKVLAAELQRRVAAAFVPVRQPSEPAAAAQAEIAVPR